MVLLPPFYLDLTVAIGNPKNEWLGTGFLYGSPNKPIYLVTNKHVLEDIHEKYEEIVIRFNDETSSTDFHVNIGTEEQPEYFNHPDGNIDISIISLSYIIELNEAKFNSGLKIGAFEAQNSAYTIEEMKDNSVAEGDFIYVIGFPMGMDSVNKKSPIVRTGCIARISDLYNQESNQFLLDTFVFPGNSGSPIILKTEFQSYRAPLIGIVDGYETYKETLVTENEAHFRSCIVQNAGLAKVYPVDFIDQTIIAYEKGHLTREH